MPDNNGLPLRSDFDVKEPILGKSAYDISKKVVQVILPAIATLYAGLASVAPEIVPYPTQVVAIIGLLVVFLGSVLQIDSKRVQEINKVDAQVDAAKVQAQLDGRYTEYDGKMVVNHSDPMADNFSLDLSDVTAEELAAKKQIVLKVEDKTK